MIIVLYHGDVLELPSLEGIQHVHRCYNPFCGRYIQTRPSNETLAGRPKQFCTDRCRWRWKNKRANERRRMAEMKRREELH